MIYYRGSELSMMSVTLSSLWDDQIEERVKGINEAADNINKYVNFRFLNDYKEEYFKDICCDINDVLMSWVGSTYVGKDKQISLKKAFQNFFINLMDLLVFFKDSDISSETEKEIGEQCLFQGKIYRYLGSGYSKLKVGIIPEYNDIYVSWSKLDKISYIESKLFGVKTLMECVISKPYYGIDLEGFGVSRPFEREVVFPTLKNLITNIDYTI